jgi:hypothetical protein
MNELKRRLLETEAQMSRILQAMEAVQQKVTATTATVGASLNGLVMRIINLYLPSSYGSHKMLNCPLSFFSLL